MIGVFRENVGNVREGKRCGEKRARRRLDLSPALRGTLVAMRAFAPDEEEAGLFRCFFC